MTPGPELPSNERRRARSARMPRVNATTLFEEAERRIASSDIEAQIARIESGLLREAQATATASVTIEGSGTYHKLPSGGWRGPGGNYGPDTLLGKRLEQKLRGEAPE